MTTDPNEYVPDENEPQTLAVTQAQPEPVDVPIKPATTAQQARIEAVSNLTFKAYERASQLVLTSDEIARLTADFPDDAFRPGAAGKADLLYLEHAHLRDRFNTVLGPGQWAIIPRARWAEAFKTNKGTDGQRVYVEAMLLVRGAFVAEAVGDMAYYSGNESQNYGDAVEGAKTAAFRRCAKELGVGLQAWKRSWCEGWFQRNRGQAAKYVEIVKPTVRHEPTSPTAPRAPTEKTRQWFIQQLTERNLVNAAMDYYMTVGKLGDRSTLADLPLSEVPTAKEKLNELIHLFASFDQIPGAEVPVAQWHTPDEPCDPNSPSAPWRSFKVPFGKNKDVELAKLDKRVLYGFWANYLVATEFNGRPRTAEQIAEDTRFRKALDEAGKHYEFTLTKKQ